MHILSIILLGHHLITTPPKQPESYTMKANVTAYTAGYESTQKHKGDKGYGITTSGAHVQQGETAACPLFFPFGTRLYFPALHESYECEDRGSAITRGHIDLFFSSLSDALQFGRQHLKMEVIKP